MPAPPPVATLHESNPGPPVLRYGTKRSWNQRRVTGLVLLIALVLPAAWWSRAQMRQWIADRHTRAATQIDIDQELALCADSISNGQWAHAQTSIDRARLAASACRKLFTRAELSAFTQRIDGTQASLQSEQERIMRLQGPVPSLRQRMADELNAARSVRIRSDAIANLNDAADRLIRERNYADALELLRQSLILEPVNERALGLLSCATTRLQGVQPTSHPVRDDP